MTAASMSWRVPAHPQGAASTPARRTSTPQATLTLPKLSLETRRSWRSSLQTWIKPWRRCETWVWWRVWRRRTTPPQQKSSVPPQCPCASVPLPPTTCTDTGCPAPRRAAEGQHQPRGTDPATVQVAGLHW